MAEFLDLMLIKGADINVCSLTGFSLLNSVLLSRGYWLPFWNDPIDLPDILLANGTQTNPTLCTITPLQSAFAGIRRTLKPRSTKRDIDVFDSFNGRGLKKVFCIVLKLLEHGAAVNGVSHDVANVTRIRQSCHIYFQQLKEDSEPPNKTECISEALEARGLTALYDTPLRMLDQLGDDMGAMQSTNPGLEGLWQEFHRIRKLLVSYGAKSLHLFLVEDLPGYVKEDMEEWKKIKDLQVANSSSTSILGHQIDSQI
jgi:hypothetical protein